VCVATDTVAAASAADAVDRLASVASTGAKGAATTNPRAEAVIEIGDARVARNTSDMGDAMDVDAPSAADEVNPDDQATPPGRSYVISLRYSGRMPPPAAGSSGLRASEKRTATRNANASANAFHQLNVCSACCNLSCTLLLLRYLHTAAAVLDEVFLFISYASTAWASLGRLRFPSSRGFLMQASGAGLQLLENQQARHPAVAH